MELVSVLKVHHTELVMYSHTELVMYSHTDTAHAADKLILGGPGCHPTDISVHQLDRKSVV